MTTSIEQSEHLVELGIDSMTADMYYTPINMDFPWVWRSKPLLEKGGVPAWSLEALLKLIPYNVTHNNAVYRFKLVKYPDKWQCYHENFGSSSTGIQEGKTALEAAYNMVIWLKENGKI